MSTQLIYEEEASALELEAPGRNAGEELPALIRYIVQDLGGDREADLVRDTFVSLMELLHDLQGVKVNGSGEDSLEEAMAAFSSVQGKTLDLVSRIENQIPLLDESSGSPESALLDVSFALRHELQRAFEMDMAEMSSAYPIESAEGRVAHAHGVLRNCFRQCVVLLAQAFDPSLNEHEVFADAASRLEESIILRDALSSLLASVQGAAKKGFPQSAVSVIERLDLFRREGRRYLMRRDWELFDAIENEIVEAKDEAEFEVVVRKSVVTLETLLGQVRMRAVFREEATAEPASGRFHVGLLQALAGVRPAAWSAAAMSLTLACVLAFFANTSLEIRGSQTAAGAGAESVPRTTAIRETKQPAAETKEFAKAVAPAKSEKPAGRRDSGNGLTLQVGAFRDRAVAFENAARLKRLGADVRVAEAQKGGQVIYRVQVGNFASDVDAARFGKRLRTEGFAAGFIIIRAG